MTPSFYTKALERDGQLIDIEHLFNVIKTIPLEELGRLGVNTVFWDKWEIII